VLPLQLTQERELGVEQLVGVGQGRRADVRFGGELAAGDRRDAEGRRLGRAPPAVQLVDVVVVGVDGPADEPYGAGGDRGGRDHRSVSAVPGVDRGIQPTAGRPEGRLTRLQRGVVVREQTALDVVVLVDRHVLLLRRHRCVVWDRLNPAAASLRRQSGFSRCGRTGVAI
jgi:hypothetical protein